MCAWERLDVTWSDSDSGPTLLECGKLTFFIPRDVRITYPHDLTIIDHVGAEISSRHKRNRARTFESGVLSYSIVRVLDTD